MSVSGFYVDRESAQPRLHPVTKIFLLMMAFVSALMLEHPLWLLGLGIFYALVSRRTGVFQGLRRVSWLLLLVALASFLIWSLTFNGKTIALAIGPLTVTREGMIFGAGMGVRLDLMIFCGLIFLATTAVEDFTYGLTRLGLPFPLAFALSLSFRLLPLFADTVRTIQDAQNARGLEPASGIFGRFRGFVPLLVPVFASALRRADLLALALEARGFGLLKKRGSLREYPLGKRDAAALIIMVAVIALELAARSYGWGMLKGAF